MTMFLTDSNNDALVVETVEHFNIHKGRSFVVEGFSDRTVSHVYDIQITTPNSTKLVHLIYEILCESETAWSFTENCAIVLAGTALPKPNRSRPLAAAVATMVIKGITNADTTDAEADTTITGKTPLGSGIIGLGKKDGGSKLLRGEWILAANEDYCLRIISTVAGNISWSINWYENINKQ